jgi:hypothetical protein
MQSASTQIPAGSRRGGAGAAAGRALLREALRTSPGRLRLMAAGVVVGALCFGVVATLAERSRANAVNAARTATEPLLGQAVALYGALSDAEATVTTTFLTGGLEPPARRARYLRDLRVAGDALAALARDAGSAAGAQVAVRTIADELPIYAGLVESARAANLQGFPVGAAYLREAASVLAGQILPAADRLYAEAARRLGADVGSGTDVAPLVVLAAAAATALALLVAMQRRLSAMTRRRVNVASAVATAMLVALAAWALIGLVAERSDLARAQRDGSDAVELASATAVLLSRAQGDLSLTLVNRGSDETDPQDFATVMRTLAPPRGLIAAVAAPGTPLAEHFGAYAARAGAIAGQQSAGNVQGATTLASSHGSIAIADTLHTDLAALLATGQARFADAAADAGSALDGLWPAIPLAALALAGLGLLGLAPRIGEYR